MENLENIEEAKHKKTEVEYLPKGGFEVKNIALDTQKKKDSLVNNESIIPGEDPDVKEGSDADAASS